MQKQNQTQNHRMVWLCVPAAWTVRLATNRLVTNRPVTNRPATSRPATNRPATNRPSNGVRIHRYVQRMQMPTWAALLAIGRARFMKISKHITLF